MNEPPSIVSLTAVHFLRSDPVLLFPGSMTHGNLLYVNLVNEFATYSITINECCDVNVSLMKIPENSDEFVHIVEQFNCWLTEVD